VAQTIDPSLITPHVVELGKLFQGLELKILRGNGEEVLGHLKQGDVELGIAAEIGDEWERLDSWPLFTEDFHLLVHSMHALAARPTISVDDLRQERLMIRTYADTNDKLLDLLQAREFDVTRFHEVSADGDLLSLLEAGVGVALTPRSTQSPATLVRIAVEDLAITRTVTLYGVAGRQRTAVASAMMKMLRAYDWSRYAAA
jgi:DNA-binding transcriptional LysR family regulator